MTPIPPRLPAVFIAPARGRRSMYGPSHPLGIPRVSLALDLIRAYGAIGPGELMAARRAADCELLTFHTPDYVSAVRRAQALGRVRHADRERFGLGTLENPFFERLFDQPATVAGAAIQAAEAVIAGRIAFNAAGGMHHARPDRAVGFCYFNDPVLSILRLRREGWRVLYLDIDAHHGDGVEEAFAGDPAALTMSLHMDPRHAYPYRGGAFSDQGTAAGGHATINLPLPPGASDSEYRAVFDAWWQPTLARFRPDAVVLQAGTDALWADPLGKLGISTPMFLEVVVKVLAACPRHADGTPRLLVTGGGGYHPLLLARAWTGLWGIVSGRELPAAMPEAGAALLRGVEWDLAEDESWFDSLFASRLDPAREGPVRPDVANLAAAVSDHAFFADPRRAAARPIAHER